MTNPPGWYPDPFGQAELRWWDGAAWQAQVSTHQQAPAPRQGPGWGTAAAVIGGLILFVVAVVAALAITTRGAQDTPVAAGTPEATSDATDGQDAPTPPDQPTGSTADWCAAWDDYQRDFDIADTTDLDDPTAMREAFLLLGTRLDAMSATAPPEIASASDLLAENWLEVLQLLDDRDLWGSIEEAEPLLDDLVGERFDAALNAVDDFDAANCG